MRALAVGLVCLSVAACAAPAEAPSAPDASGPQRQADLALPPVPFEEEGACPFEGCVYRQWTTTASVDVREGRTLEAPIAFTVPAGQRVTAQTGVVVTTKPGRVRFRRTVDLPSESGAIHVEPGQDLHLLTYTGEGYFTAAFAGIVYRNVDGGAFFNGACEEGAQRCVGEIVEPPESTWWVQLRNAAGQVGWTNEPAKFDGKDALAAAH